MNFRDDMSLVMPWLPGFLWFPDSLIFLNGTMEPSPLWTYLLYAGLVGLAGFHGATAVGTTLSLGSQLGGDLLSGWNSKVDLSRFEYLVAGVGLGIGNLVLVFAVRGLLEHYQLPGAISGGKLLQAQLLAASLLGGAALIVYESVASSPDETTGDVFYRWLRSPSVRFLVTCLLALVVPVALVDLVVIPLVGEALLLVLIIGGIGVILGTIVALVTLPLAYRDGGWLPRDDPTANETIPSVIPVQYRHLTASAGLGLVYTILLIVIFILFFVGFGPRLEPVFELVPILYELSVLLFVPSITACLLGIGLVVVYRRNADNWLPTGSRLRLPLPRLVVVSLLVLSLTPGGMLLLLSLLPAANAAVLTFWVVGLFAVAGIHGTIAAAVTLPGVLRRGGWLFQKRTLGAGPDPAPVRHLAAGAGLGIINLGLVVTFLEFLYVPNPRWAAFTPQGREVLLAQVVVVVSLGIAALFAHGLVVAVRSGASSETPGRWTLAPRAGQYLAGYLLALVALAALVESALHPTFRWSVVAVGLGAVSGAGAAVLALPHPPHVGSRAGLVPGRPLGPLRHIVTGTCLGIIYFVLIWITLDSGGFADPARQPRTIHDLAPFLSALAIPAALLTAGLLIVARRPVDEQRAAESQLPLAAFWPMAVYLLVLVLVPCIGLFVLLI